MLGVCFPVLLMCAQPNVLVDATGRARITDFGLATVTQNLDFIETPWGDECHTTQWTAPEILNEEGVHSKEADVFSFAMVMIEVRYERALRIKPWLTAVSCHHRRLLAWFRSIISQPQRLRLQ